MALGNWADWTGSLLRRRIANALAQEHVGANNLGQEGLNGLNEVR